jgi:hypothetical protein
MHQYPLCTWNFHLFGEFFWSDAVYFSIGGYIHFEGNCCLYLHGRLNSMFLYGVVNQKTAIQIFTAMKTSNGVYGCCIHTKISALVFTVWCFSLLAGCPVEPHVVFLSLVLRAAGHKWRPKWGCTVFAFCVDFLADRSECANSCPTAYVLVHWNTWFIHGWCSLLWQAGEWYIETWRYVSYVQYVK